MARAASPPDELVRLFVISFVILFLELACIRWFGSTVVFLTFFTNIVLLSTFLGMSVGCLAASGRRQLIELAMPLLLGTVVLATGVLFIYSHSGAVMIDVGGQGSPQQIYFGTEYRARDLSRFVVPIEAVAGTFFVLIASVFIGLGQVMGRALDRVPNRVAAYAVNIGGSLAGTAGFALVSYLQTPPAVWFGIALGLWIGFCRRRTVQLVTLAAILLIVSLPNRPGSAPTLWSPYYKVTYVPESRAISTNNIGHQQMASVARNGAGYLLPHLLNRDAGGPPFEQVLVIGAGSGNDVAAALRQGARHVDAVEIDPVIYALGRRDHPDQPYADPRVTVHIDDGRSFLRRTDQQYDLIVYALVDSLVLHSGYSTIRLESFLFTADAFRDVRARLKPGGVFAAYNFFRQGWLVGRVKKMMVDAFGDEPLVMSFPYVERIEPGDPSASITFILDGARSPALARIRQQFERHSFWINNQPATNDAINGFSVEPPSTSARWNRIRPAAVGVRSGERLPTDDWPFLYLRDPVVPAVNLRGILLMAALSLAVLFVFAPVRRAAPNWPMFFMGAGFMLLETKSVVHLALLFGSTWMVNSIVFFAILVMILCGNLFVLVVRPRRVWPYYLGLAGSLLAGVLVPLNAFLALSGTFRVVASCAAVFVPIFFAGIVFTTAFRDSVAPDWDFGSNIAGSILGGLSESLSLGLGFNHVLILALAFYVLSAVFRIRRGAIVPAVV
jgi:SAM-dependent methyltransferase